VLKREYDGLYENAAGVSQCVAVCCSVLRCVAVRCKREYDGLYESAAVCCSVLLYIAVCCSVLQ